MIKVALTDSQVELIVVQDLMLAYALNLKDDYDEGGALMDKDIVLLDALSKVLQYYLPASSHETWLLQNNNTKELDKS